MFPNARGRWWRRQRGAPACIAANRALSVRHRIRRLSATREGGPAGASTGNSPHNCGSPISPYLYWGGKRKGPLAPPCAAVRHTYMYATAFHASHSASQRPFFILLPHLSAAAIQNYPGADQPQPRK
ncbi:unnamed protein product [Chondrus crispus]|uniref:Uncharacterized protein n=1 Tax=Chondrus crispus TaxID=2769 RepID=R7QDE1_CHOCR|nr:unnamed protein product [Chondrus crispus]CDF35803.1 unnamed protein product [Chondrus crispus]|eukprot:XP_005715622.1 unnamed protein product [Chondrus crispus]